MCYTSSMRLWHSSVHSKALHQRQQCKTSTMATASNTEEIASSVVKPVNLQAHCDSTFQVEVVWILKNVSDQYLVNKVLKVLNLTRPWGTLVHYYKSCLSHTVYTYILIIKISTTAALKS